ncbi:MAG: Lrp/AsnC family transcriptional regulator [Gammaproteobacteria bacterium]|nr:Lrp/AsnC family transcriptional regulator [Gammaproteobacteria bacterium]
MNNFDYDELDHKIVEALMTDASQTSANIGELIGLSASATNERIRRLKNAGVIHKTVALVDSRFMEMELGAFIFVLVEKKEDNAAFLKQAIAHKNVLECHHLTGEYSYALKVRVANTRALESFISDLLKSQTGVTKTMTQIILSSHKEMSIVVDCPSQ